MKKIGLLWLTGVLMLLPAGLVSCSDDDEGPGSVPELIGTWELVSSYYQYKENGKVVDEGTDTEGGLRVTFREDGTFQDAEYDNDSGWELYAEGGKWSYKDGKLSMNYYEDGELVEAQTAAVKELTGSRLVLETTFKYSDGGISIEEYSLGEFRKVSD